MRALRLGTIGPTVLCVGAHSDDIEIGAGGTILALSAAESDARIHWTVLSALGGRAGEAKRGAESFAGERLASLSIHDFPDGFFPAHFDEIKRILGEVATSVEPDVVFTHWRGDLHQDHRLVADVTRQSFRDALILEYEILKYDGDLGGPNLYVPLSPDDADLKVRRLMEIFGSQIEKHWFTSDTFRALMRVRGVECRSASGYAEAFYGYKAVLHFGDLVR